MDRKKPALTSPWKVGFLVALLLVVTSIGVSYFITGTFGVTWHWIHFGGLSPATWTFNLGAFIEEMLPVLGLTIALAFAAHVLVAGAVRRYKAYVDSGVEYKQLLKSIKSLEDLEDHEVLDRLKQHPELREFLMGFKHRAAAAERAHSDRKPAPASAPAARDERPRLQSESALLASAVANGRDAFSRELALTVPELKQIERALREYFANTSESSPAETPAPSEPAGSADLDALRDRVRGTAKSLRRDVDACATGAREFESALAGLLQAIQGGSTSAPAASTGAIEKRIDMTAQALGALGEETRRIAIGSAMQASGGAEADAIKVADEVRALATKFNTVAQHWRETAPAIKEALGAQGVRGPSDAVAATAANVVSRARLWSERAIAMTEHVRALESAAESNDTPPARRAPSSSAADLDVTPSIDTSSASGSGDDFITHGAAETFASEDDDTSSSFVDIPGFEKEHKFFADTSSVELSDDRFVVDRAEENRWDLADKAETPAASAAASPAPAAAPASESSHDADGFLTGPRPVVSPKKIAKAKDAPAPAPAPAPAALEPVAATATLDPDADAMDLYALGAVDCVQTT